MDTPYARLATLGMAMTEQDRAEMGRLEKRLRRLQRRYDDDDLGELADQCYIVSAPVVVATEG